MIPYQFGTFLYDLFSRSLKVFLGSCIPFLVDKWEFGKSSRELDRAQNAEDIRNDYCQSPKAESKVKLGEKIDIFQEVCHDEQMLLVNSQVGGMRIAIEVSKGRDRRVYIRTG